VQPLTKAGDIVRVPLPDGRFAYLRHVSQHANYGVLMEVKSLFDEGRASMEDVMAAPNLFNPIFVAINPHTYGRLAAVQYGGKDLNPQGNAFCPKGLHREEFTYTNGGRPTNKTLKLTRKFADLSNAERTAQIAIDYEYETTGDKLMKKVTYPVVRGRSPDTLR
jgi:hypothetical protein